MKREIRQTADGSKTIYIKDWNESYHSIHGAVQEAYHVFIKNGFDLLNTYKFISILEMGLGTGLNAFISLMEAEKQKKMINYVGVEKFPITEEEFIAINSFEIIFNRYPEFKSREEEFKTYYQQLFYTNWEEKTLISSFFTLTKLEKDFFDLDFDATNLFDLIYFDAFGARVQPELWTKELFEKLYFFSNNKAIFTTYSSKGSVRRALVEVGFKVEKRPGPPNKREMLVAYKL